MAHPSLSKRNIAGILERELGAGAVIGPGHEQLDDYGRDESPLPEFFPPECAVLVESVEQAAIVLRLCLEHRVPVTPRGVTGTRCSRQRRSTIAACSTLSTSTAHSGGKNSGSGDSSRP